MPLAAYFIKKKTKYPKRIFVFMQFEQWAWRNLRPMGLINERPFAVRKMTELEIKDCEALKRLSYCQYEDFELFIQDEQKAGVEQSFIEKKLLPVKNRFEKLR